MPEPAIHCLPQYIFGFTERKKVIIMTIRQCGVAARSAKRAAMIAGTKQKGKKQKGKKQKGKKHP